ncbi:hypothetical protein HYALB_00013741 [Hymenoscyphus albidus]|uniref:Uncharacterized protein n=1 Tax=Hymenoscyphus albidus TaxID=595503 RepID=A0A9N9LSM3_9HELO|nr:hypothetical protein HYALB_00013741 [Hymenoscyphus albidus]
MSVTTPNFLDLPFEIQEKILIEVLKAENCEIITEHGNLSWYNPFEDINKQLAIESKEAQNRANDLVLVNAPIAFMKMVRRVIPFKFEVIRNSLNPVVLAIDLHCFENHYDNIYVDTRGVGDGYQDQDPTPPGTGITTTAYLPRLIELINACGNIVHCGSYRQYGPWDEIQPYEIDITFAVSTKYNARRAPQVVDEIVDRLGGLRQVYWIYWRSGPSPTPPSIQVNIQGLAANAEARLRSSWGVPAWTEEQCYEIAEELKQRGDVLASQDRPLAARSHYILCGLTLIRYGFPTLRTFRHKLSLRGVEILLEMWVAASNLSTELGRHEEAHMIARTAQIARKCAQSGWVDRYRQGIPLGQVSNELQVQVSLQFASTLFNIGNAKRDLGVLQGPRSRRVKKRGRDRLAQPEPKLLKIQ